jgi:Bacterial Ig domain/Secretion system C-terminal sorting domain/Carbohydrate binding module (family 35)
MGTVSRVTALLATLLMLHTGYAQSNRMRYNNQDLYLSGANLAWINFAHDIGPGQTDFDAFAEILLQMHDHGGNAVRWWLHTNGTSTPQFNSADSVIGPGVNAIANLRQALDLAWEREIGVDLCLWSFDMLRSSNSPSVLNRNRLLLTDTTYTRAFINNALIPIVDSLRGHPGILVWEIFNEPEGMSNEFGWSDIQHVPMSAIQRFVNMCAGAIHRTDSTALVTSGVWSFKALTDVPTAIAATPDAELTPAQREEAAIQLKEKYRSSLTPEQIISHLETVAGMANFNYYSDSRLIAEGGDPDGTLDFYSVHYYTGIDPTNPGGISPFHHPWSFWGLDKPIVVAEFAMQITIGVPKEALFETLYQTGYAGALPWSWTDVNISSHADMLAGMQYMWDNHRYDVDVLGIGGYWPNVTIVSPANDTTFVDTTAIPIVAVASDSDGTVVSVAFFVSDTAQIGERTSPPYSMVWANVPSGAYTLTAVATDNQGHTRTSNRVRISVGRPAMARLEAETAIRQGSGMTVRNDASASGGMFLDMATQSGTVTWQLHNVPVAGNYEIALGFRLFYDHPKTQYINVNGIRADTVVFDGTSSTTWFETPLHVDLVQGDNTIQMELFWGWMYLDYLAVPANIATSVESPIEVPAEYSLQQNYPNPFNPVTIIEFALPKDGAVTLKVYDIIGREVKTLVNDQRTAGEYAVKLDASDLASGVYIYRLQANGFVSSKKMIVLK